MLKLQGMRRDRLWDDLILLSGLKRRLNKHGEVCVMNLVLDDLIYEIAFVLLISYVRPDPCSVIVNLDDHN